ncbi:uncharacterized protein LOC141849356 [Brevipalpus obovatus]|uniref:uncharacterized protein LOC141849356 n=1 Tax=Brevipalpus obovatus TaxID=246614 RepID=UPI003D9E9949
MIFAILLTLFTTILCCVSTNTVKGSGILSAEEIKQICSKSPHLAKEKVEKLLETQIIRKLSRSKPEPENKAKNYKNRDQVVALLNDNTIGQNGELAQFAIVGTGTSTGNHLEPIFKQQADNNFNHSEIKEIVLFINNVADLSRERHEHLQKDLQAGTNNLTLDECTKTAQTLYDQEIGRLQSKKNHDHNIIMKSNENTGKSGNIPWRGQMFDDENNVTVIDTRLKLASDGTNAYYVGISRDEATNHAVAPITDLQDHGVYENSQVNLVDVEVFSST